MNILWGYVVLCLKVKAAFATSVLARAKGEVSIYKFAFGMGDFIILNVT